MMELGKLEFAHLTESELQKLIETEKFLNSQPDHKALKEKGNEIYLLAFVDKDKKM